LSNLSVRYPRTTRFKSINRKESQEAVLIPGWATDYRIFEGLNLKYNYLIPTNFYPFDFEDILLRTLKKRNIKKISLFGFSLGGFLAAEFASRHSHLVDKLILIGTRLKYRHKEIDNIRKLLRKSKVAFLYKFYSQCFEKKIDFIRFKNKLFRDYCENFDLDYLMNTLDYLESARIRPESLRGIKHITIIHGRLDRIAPFSEAVCIKDSLPDANFIDLKDEGHMPFLKEDFGDYL